ncbi:MAG: dTDP-4-dehydrorhamnose reductase [Bacilli bacterium]|nr:dTDP-4-dehydrorhamnose reductase [Bacilli bacterium]MDD4809254.1 dTDP-4-dehydrorhamnose reductase [Bacilli bacterium]
MIIVTGYTGQLGYDVTNELENRGFKNIVSLGSKDLDITDRQAVIEKITTLKPSVIFHNAAYTKVDLAEEDYEKCYSVNVLGTENIVEAAKLVDAKIIYISTDYVFDGKKEGFYDIKDKPNPLNVYGKTKYLGEIIVKKYPKHFIVRTSWVFGKNGPNFITTMLNLSEIKNELNIVNDQIGSPTYSVDLAKLLVEISMTEKYGIYHATNDGYCSWDEFAEYIFKINAKNVEINKVKTSEYIAKAIRPLNSKLNKQSLIDNDFEGLPSWKDAVKRYSLELKKEMRK